MLTDEEFLKQLKGQMKRLGLDSIQVGRTLRVSSMTVGRWVNGMTTPHPYMRQGIINALAEMPEKKK